MRLAVLLPNKRELCPLLRHLWLPLVVNVGLGGMFGAITVLFGETSVHPALHRCQLNDVRHRVNLKHTAFRQSLRFPHFSLRSNVILKTKRLCYLHVYAQVLLY